MTATKEKSSNPAPTAPGQSRALWAMLCLVVTFLLSGTRAEAFFTPPDHAPSVLATAAPESAGQNYDGSHYDALDSLIAANSGPSTTRLFRAVEGDELADVMRYGDYNIHPNSTFKRFAFDEGSLDTFIQANPGRSYTKTFIDVPTENLGQMYRHADPGGVGKSIGIDVYETPTFYNWFDKVNILGK